MEKDLTERLGGIQNSKQGKKDLQMERTRAAFERLQLAWVRTSLTILAIGIGAYEFFFNRLESGKKPLFEEFTGRELALILYGVASAMMILSLIQHRQSMARLKMSYPESRYSIATFLSVLMLLLGMILLGMLLWKSSNP
ncbi:MAG: DUF202 domain-containing protein [Cyclobacteriaceae bacterium]|nr:DUF202 domain-containing protein [Cyclobacteriaceae bacterium]MDX5465687.1 DUF202 domain-containing protein [Cyclobacteriaceae bacterium]